MITVMRLMGERAPGRVAKRLFKFLDTKLHTSHVHFSCPANKKKKKKELRGFHKDSATCPTERRTHCKPMTSESKHMCLEGAVRHPRNKKMQP